MVAASSAPSRFTRRARFTDRIWPRWAADGSVRPFLWPGAATTSTGYGVGDSFEVTAATMVDWTVPISDVVLDDDGRPRLLDLAASAGIELHQPDLAAAGKTHGYLAFADFF